MTNKPIRVNSPFRGKELDGKTVKFQYRQTNADGLTKHHEGVGRFHVLGDTGSIRIKLAVDRFKLNGDYDGDEDWDLEQLDADAIKRNEVGDTDFSLITP